MKIWQLFPVVVAVLVSFSPYPAFSQQVETGTVEGILLDESTERPLRGVGVRLIGSDTETRTDIKGRFSLTVPSGDYAGIVVDSPSVGGLSLIEARVSVEAGAIDNLEEILISASSTIGAAPQSPAPSSPGPDPLPEDSGQTGMAAPPDIPFVPWLGVIPDEVPADYGPQGGSRVAVVVGRVFRGSPAEQAGFQQGDFIDSVNERPVTGAYDLFQAIASSPIGQPVEILLNRRGETIRTKPILLPVPEPAVMAIRELATGAAAGPPGSPQGGGGAPPQQGFEPPGGNFLPPLIEEARRQADRGNFQASDRAYDEYLRANPSDGRVWAEYSEMVFLHIQQARGMQLMAQAVKKPGLSPPEKTRLRLIVAQRRLESGNLVTAKQMLIEAKRDDPFNPVIDELLTTIEVIQLQASGQVPGGPPQAVPFNQPGAPVDGSQLLLNELVNKIAEELEDD